MQPLSPDALDALLTAPVAIVYKHSGRCPISIMAQEEIRALEEQRPGTPVWVVDVNAQRPLSRALAERLDVEHHSPQVILLVRGTPAWHASHFQITADGVAARLAAVERSEGGSRVGG